jgi:hypothetical protein
MHGTQKQNDAVPTYLSTNQRTNQTKPSIHNQPKPKPKTNQPTKGWAILLHIIAFKWLMLS